MKVLSLLLACALLCPRTAHAQTVPAWSFEIAAGSGLRTEHAGNIWYEGNRTSTLRVALGHRFGAAARLAPYATLEAGPNLAGNSVLICLASPNGTCREDFADNGSVGAGLGARLALTRHILLGAQAGGGQYGHRARGFIEANAALRLGTHVAIASTARYMRWSVNGYQHWYRPVTLGIQIL